MFDSFAARYQKFAPVFLRIGLAFVFLLFGIQKLTHPGQATSETQLLTNFELADAAAVNFYLGLVELAIAIWEAVCRELDFGHSNVVLHRDLKPSNKWLTIEGVVEFGDFTEELFFAL